MNTTPPQLSHAPPHSALPRPVAPRRDSARPTLSTGVERLGETAPLITAPAFFGPPILALLGPWLLLVLVLIGPMALILTMLIAIAIAVGALAALLCVLATPYLLVRRFHAFGTARANRPPGLPRLGNRRASSGRLGLPQTKGMS